jgi:4-diphosphocytidyl-2-C-methyl-D-erythritol kinase
VTATIVQAEACAKINLRLAVLARETTGYHSLETILCGISLSDRIEIRRSDPGIDLDVTGGIATGPPEQNLVYRAAFRFFELSGIEPDVRISLEKRIPAAAGLGGGSSDAASTLLALDSLFEHPLSPRKLLQIAAELGSDIPFFLTGTPLALAWSRGERLLELPPLPPRPVVVAHPGVALPTPGAFARLAELRDGERAVAPVALPLDTFDSWESVAPLAINDFEMVAFERIPSITRGIRSFIDAGARVSLLAGSGASIFGIFDSLEDAARAERSLAATGFATWQASTLDAWPQPVSQD